MHLKNNGYTRGALLFIPTIRKMREHIELEKFMCRVLVDDEKTREMQQKTEQHSNKLFNLRFNNENSIKLTAAGKKHG